MHKMYDALFCCQQTSIDKLHNIFLAEISNNLPYNVETIIVNIKVAYNKNDSYIFVRYK